MTKPTILIIAGGENSRFTPLNTKTHKGFLSLGGKPIVVRALENLKKHGFYNIVLVLSQKDFDGQGFSKYLDTHDHGLNITTVLQKDARGMGDALLTAKNYLSEQFILANPYYSNLGEISEKLIHKQQESNAKFVFSGANTNHTQLYGILEFDNNDATKVVGLVEKPKEGEKLSNVKIDSVYLFDKSFIEDLANNKKTENSFEKAVSSFVKKNHGTWILNTSRSQSLKYPWHLFNLFNQIIENEKTYFSSTAKISETAIFDDTNGPVVVDDNAIIGDFVKLVGPCYIGRNTLVGDYSFVRGSTIEAGAVVGANTEIVRSIIFENSSVHYGYLADSILGHNNKVGAGLITANKRLDRKNIRIKIKNDLLDMKTNTFGIITGENVNIGIRVSTMPGVTISANTQILPGTTVNRNL